MPLVAGGAGTKEAFFVAVPADMPGHLKAGVDKVVTAGADCSAELQEMLDTIEAYGGGTLLLLPGTYVIGSSLLLGDNVCLAGTGPATVLEAATDRLIKNKAGSSKNKNITIKNLKVDLKDAHSYAVFLYSSENSLLENLTVRGITSYKGGIYCNGYVTVKNYDYEGSSSASDAFLLQGPGTSLEGGVIRNTNNAKVYSGKVTGVTFYNARLDIQDGGSVAGCYFFNSSNIYLSSIYPEWIAVTGNYFHESWVWQEGGSDSITISGNTFSDSGIKYYSTGTGSPAYENVITGNTFHQSRILDSSATDLTRSLIIGNTFLYTGTDVVLDLSSSENILVTNNVFRLGSSTPWPFNLHESAVERNNMVNYYEDGTPKLVYTNQWQKTISVNIGVSGAWGTAAYILPDQHSIGSFELKLTIGGSFGASEQVDVEIAVIRHMYNPGDPDDIAATITKSYTSTAEEWLSRDEVMNLTVDLGSVWKLRLKAKTNLDTTLVTVSADGYGEA